MKRHHNKGRTWNLLSPQPKSNDGHTAQNVLAMIRADVDTAWAVLTDSYGEHPLVGEMTPEKACLAFQALAAWSMPHEYGHSDRALDMLIANVGANHAVTIDDLAVTVVVGNAPTTMFTSHTDSATSQCQPVRFVLSDNDRFIRTDARNILSADDKAGVLIMLTMISNGVEGMYCFFRGEESGCIGSSAFAADTSRYQGITAVVSFDRRGTHDIISSQMGNNCVSQEYLTGLTNLYAREGVFLYPAAGSFTDSYSFVSTVNDCTNISVGYDKAHSNSEEQDLCFLSTITNASCRIDWASVPRGKPTHLPDRRYPDSRYYGTPNYAGSFEIDSGETIRSTEWTLDLAEVALQKL